MYIRTDEEVEAVEALSMAARMAEEVDVNTGNWRWVILALHNSLQGFMVLSLRHGNGLLALSKKSYAKWMEAHEGHKQYPADKLDSYLGLYSKVKSNSAGQAGGNQRFQPKASEGKSIKKLNSLRNDFIHFTPKGWCLEADGLPQICRDCLCLVAFLGWETSNIFWHDLSNKESSQLSYYRLQLKMESLDKMYQELSS